MLFFAILCAVYLMQLGAGETRRWMFEGSLLPALRMHLKSTNQYSEDRFQPSGIGRLAFDRDQPPETTCTVVEGDSAIIVLPQYPLRTPTPCIWYDKNTGEYSRLEIVPWK